MDIKHEFIEFLMGADVLRFGEFTLKSGRKSPYFLNAGGFKTGAQLAALGRFYARVYKERFGETLPVVFGPAYKGIPIAAATATGLAAVGIDAPYFFNRKEEKDHGEGGLFVGYVPKAGESVVIVDDVITAGTAVRESVGILSPLGVKIVGQIVTVDRMERGKGSESAAQEVEREFGFPVCPFVTPDDIMGYLRAVGTDAGLLERMEAYRNEYGVR